MKLPSYDWLWVFWIAYFFVVEGIGIWHEVKFHGNDEFTFTHFAAVLLPIGLRAAFIAWLAWHFLIAHKVG